jgi:hypothetical protein
LLKNKRGKKVVKKTREGRTLLKKQEREEGC